MSKASRGVRSMSLPIRVSHEAAAMRYYIIVAILFAGLCVLPVQADSIINGDFSEPNAATLPNDGSVYKFIYAGDPSLTGWTVTNGSVATIVVAATFGAPSPSGNPQDLDLDGNSAGTISQSFATTPGASYTLSFNYYNDPTGDSIPAAATVSVSGSNLASQIITHGDSAVGDLYYSSFSGDFTANSSSATLTFASNDSASSAGGIVLDAVSVSPAVATVPLPSTLGLSAVCMLGIGTARLLRSKLT
jgi:hypothetical protein